MIMYVIDFNFPLLLLYVFPIYHFLDNISNIYAKIISFITFLIEENDKTSNSFIQIHHPPGWNDSFGTQSSIHIKYFHRIPDVF